MRRWPLLICLAHSLLGLLALGALPLPLPRLGWPWYRREDTVGQARRRLLAALAQAGIFVPEGGLGHPLPKSMPVRPPGERASMEHGRGNRQREPPGRLPLHVDLHPGPPGG